MRVQLPFASRHELLRTMSTHRLLALIAGTVLAIIGGTAIALAATGGGPVPRPKPLDTAVHDALAGRDPGGLTARVQLTNHLLGSAGIEGTTPLLNGASGRLWLTKGHLRLELQSEQGDSQVVVDKDSFWVYDVSSNTVYRGQLDAHAKVGRQRTPSLTDVRDAIAEVGHHAALSGARPTDVAGQPAYDVRIVPKDGGLVGAVRLAWDANHGVPLRVAVYAKGSRSPVAELKATKVGSAPSGIDVRGRTTQGSHGRRPLDSGRPLVERPRAGARPPLQGRGAVHAGRPAADRDPPRRRRRRACDVRPRIRRDRGARASGEAVTVRGSPPPARTRWRCRGRGSRDPAWHADPSSSTAACRTRWWDRSRRRLRRPLFGA